MFSVRIHLKKKTGKEKSIIWFSDVTAINIKYSDCIIVCVQDKDYYSSTAHYIQFDDITDALITNENNKQLFRIIPYSE